MNSYSGFIIVDKPKGWSSAQVVGKIKWLTKSKCGHAGTLDPMATGVLPIALGEATKVVQYLSDADKEYEFEVTWGEERDTDDAEGEVIKTSEIRPKEQEILQAMKNFIGEIEQIPPQYSAIKIDGKRSYDEARKGNIVDIKSRKVTIHELTLKSTDGNKSSFKMRCSKGTYVRSIARDMGRILGCLGYVTILTRTAHAGFNENDTFSLEKLEEMCKTGAVSKAILPLEKALDGIPVLSLDDLEEKKIRNGLPLLKSGNNLDVVALKNGEKLVAMASLQNGKLQPKRVIN